LAIQDSVTANLANTANTRLQNLNTSKSNSTLSKSFECPEDNLSIFSASNLIQVAQEARRATKRTACQYHFKATSALCELEEEYIHQSSLISRRYQVGTSSKPPF